MADPVPVRVVDIALSQIHDRLAAIPVSLPGLLVVRQPDKPIGDVAAGGQSLPPAGALVLLDGDGEVEEISMSPEIHHWRHVAQIEIRYPGNDLAARQAGGTALLAAVAAALAPAMTGDITLAGAVDYLSFEPLGLVEDDAAAGRKTERQILLDLVLEFATRDALGFARA